MSFKLYKQTKQFVKKIIYYPVYIQHKNNIYLIYTMGKVGSATIYNTFKQKLPFNDLFHVHFLSDNWLKNILPKSAKGLHYNIAEGQKIRSYIEHNPQKRVKIITLVREPFSRQVSDIFQNWETYYPDSKLMDQSPSTLVHALKNGSTRYVLEWFDTEFKNYTGFDIYNQTFDTQKGYQIYKHQQFDILCFQLEKLNTCYQEAINSFVNLPIRQLANINQTKDRASKELYQQTKELYYPKVETLDEVYRSKYMQHFYSKEQIADFKNKWIQ